MASAELQERESRNLAAALILAAEWESVSGADEDARDFAQALCANSRKAALHRTLWVMNHFHCWILNRVAKRP